MRCVLSSEFEAKVTGMGKGSFSDGFRRDAVVQAQNVEISGPFLSLNGRE